jgi:hypothetical protein
MNRFLLRLAGSPGFQPIPRSKEAVVMVRELDIGAAGVRSFICAQAEEMIDVR